MQAGTFSVCVCYVCYQNSSRYFVKSYDFLKIYAVNLKTKIYAFFYCEISASFQ